MPEVETATPERAAAASPPPGWVEFLRAHGEIVHRLDRLMRERHGLTLNEYEVLLQLWLAGEERLRRVDLAERLLITQGGVTRLLAGLEHRGLVERVPCPDDGRVAYASLTEAGRRLAEGARAEHLAEVEELFGGRFTDEELETLARLLGRLGSPVAA